MRPWTKHFTYVILPNRYVIDTIIIPILYMNELRLGKFTSLANKWLTQIQICLKLPVWGYE